MTTNIYTIGQVIYVLTADAVVPYQIVEENIKSTLSGKSVSYKVRCGQDNKCIDLDKITGDVFISLEDVRTTMLEKVTQFVNKHVQDAEKKAKAWYEKSVVDQQLVESELVTLPDGNKVKLNYKVT